jgi:hypothetical protein
MLPSAPQSNVKNLGTKRTGPIIHVHCTSARPNKRLRVWSYYNVCCMHPHNYINPPALIAHRNNVLDLPFKHSAYFNFSLFFHHVLFAWQGSCSFRRRKKLRLKFLPFYGLLKLLLSCLLVYYYTVFTWARICKRTQESIPSLQRAGTTTPFDVLAGHAT